MNGRACRYDIMTAYMIIEPREVWDPKKYGEYCSKVPAVVERFGGRYLARDMSPYHINGNWHPSKVVIIEFPSREKFDAWWNSPEYRALAHLRELSAEVNAVLVDSL
jgi:uncharacterized protein (DUF1330 family)